MENHTIESIEDDLSGEIVNTDFEIIVKTVFSLHFGIFLNEMNKNNSKSKYYLKLAYSKLIYERFVEEDDRMIIKIFRNLFIMNQFHKSRIKTMFFNRWKDKCYIAEASFTTNSLNRYNKLAHNNNSSINKNTIPFRRRNESKKDNIEDSKGKLSISTITYQVI
jgi:hypothetical protein